MVIIRFPSVEMRRRAVGYLLGRFSGKSWASGEIMVPETALASLAAEGVVFSVDGPATSERILMLNRTAQSAATPEATASV